MKKFEEQILSLIVGIVIGLVLAAGLHALGTDPIEQVKKDKVFIEQCIAAGGEPYELFYNTGDSRGWKCRAVISEVA